MDLAHGESVALNLYALPVYWAPGSIVVAVSPLDH